MEEIFDLNEEYDGETSGFEMSEGNNCFGQQFVELYESNTGDANLADTEIVPDAAEPKVGMCFNGGEELVAFVYTYAFKTGFEWFVRLNILLEEFNEKCVKRNRTGEKEPRFHMLKRWESMMKITQCNLIHNHPTDPCSSRLMVSFRCISDYFKDRIMLNDAAGISIANNYNSLVLEGGGHENLPFNRLDLRNAINQERRRGRIMGDAAELEDYFDRMKSCSHDFFFRIQRDIEGKLLNVFWADAHCRAMCKDFGDVTTYDTTFLCNQYDMPFSPFIGDKAIDKAVQTVFPETPYILCLWHMMRNGSKNLGSHGNWREIEAEMKRAVDDSLVVEDFDDAWKKMVEKYSLHNNPWVKESYEIRRLRQFIEQFDGALRSKVGEEKQNNFACVDRPLRCEKSILVEDVFHKLYTNDKFKEVKGEVLGLLHTNVVLVLKMGSYTKYAASEKIVNPVWRTTRKIFDVNIDTAKGEFNCTYKLFEFRGILCCHIIRCIEIDEDVKFIPDKYIVNRWRKDLVRPYESVRVGYYDPAECGCVKRSMKVTLRNDYISRLALQDDESYGIYEHGTAEVIKDLEAYCGIDNINSYAADGGSSKVWGHRRLQRKENRNIPRNTTNGDGRVKDPIDKRGSGRAPRPRQRTVRKKVNNSQSTPSKNSLVDDKYGIFGL
ncbi:hypothetical protein RND81_03G047000 [Saponaria officinalis]|uniref:Protein FAR1-RELATED SEQUENCE n=1 Tax=Saponaria officinalis TaxID=3572 RepID=A0AAW1M2N6_SAPOF